MPDPQDPDDVTRSQYQVTPQARLLCQIMEKVERRELQARRRLDRPADGQDQIISGVRAGVDGRAQPRLNMILGSYNQDFANEFGDDVRAIVNSPAHQQVFPEHELRSAARRRPAHHQQGRQAGVRRRRRLRHR
jgi:hypothetical protein